MQLRSTQEEFKQMIRQPELTPTYGRRWLHNFHGISAVNRLRVYRNNIFGALTNVLQDVYPLCEQIIGPQTFKRLAHQYIHNKFPTEACLHKYGEELPSLIKTIPKLTGSVPYLSDIARYEWLCHLSFHAPCEKTMILDDLKILTEQRFSSIPLTLNAACRLFQSAFPLQKMIEYIQEDPDDPLTYVKGQHYFVIYRFLGDVLEEEIPELFYKGLQFLQTKKGRSAKPQTMNDLTNFMIAQREPQQVGPFVHFLFSRTLIQKR
jgi:hypothetical protein